MTNATHGQPNTAPEFYFQAPQDLSALFNALSLFRWAQAPGGDLSDRDGGERTQGMSVRCYQREVAREGQGQGERAALCAARQHNRRNPIRRSNVPKASIYRRLVCIKMFPNFQG